MPIGVSVCQFIIGMIEPSTWQGSLGQGRGKHWGEGIYILKAFLLQKRSTRDIFFTPNFLQRNNHLGEKESGISLPKRQ